MCARGGKDGGGHKAQNEREEGGRADGWTGGQAHGKTDRQTVCSLVIAVVRTISAAAGDKGGGVSKNTAESVRRLKTVPVDESKNKNKVDHSSSSSERPSKCVALVLPF